MKIVLIGMSGSGKSTFGRFIANLMNMPLIDTDEEICKKYGDVSSIFASGGEKLFRELESHEGLLACEADECVVATGGGMVLHEDVMKKLRKHSLIVYLYCDSDFLHARLENDNSRPLLNGADKKQKIEEMLRSRANLYLDYAHIVLNESGILQSRNLLDSELEIQLGALYLEFMNAFEKRVYSKYSG
jgi:shikimate kinase